MRKDTFSFMKILVLHQRNLEIEECLISLKIVKDNLSSSNTFVSMAISAIHKNSRYTSPSPATIPTCINHVTIYILKLLFDCICICFTYTNG